MLSRALILAAVAFLLGCFSTIPADAQNLEAGKPPSQIFASTCSLCHKSSRGLLKSVAPGSLPGFLRQHYTTSSDMASAMSAYVLSNGAANAPAAGGNLTRQGQEAKTAPKPSITPEDKPESRPEQAAKGRKPPTREAAKPDLDGLEDGVAPAPGSPDAAPLTARQKRAEERAAKRAAAAAAAAAKGKPPKIDARHEAPKEEPPKDEPPKAEAAKEPAKEQAKDSGRIEPAKGEGTRPDPVPAVTPAPPAAGETGPATAAVTPPKPAVDDPSRPLTIDIGPAPSAPSAAPAAAVASGPSSVPAGPPIPPISR